jgi:hypothetical protein
MKLTFSLKFDGIPQLWLDGPLPLPQKQNQSVKARLNIRSASDFPRSYQEQGRLLCSGRESPLQYAVTLLLTYPLSTVPLGTPQSKKDGEWSDVPGSTIYGQIRIPLPKEAIAKISEVSSDKYDFELTLDDLKLVEYESPQGTQAKQ